MGKISIAPTNDFCPQTLFLYGTRREDGTPNFGLFCWFSYIFDGQLGVMACIGGEKKTKALIHRNQVFSANLVTEALMPLADYFGNTDGNSPDKMCVPVETENGAVLDVPILTHSPVALELRLKQAIPTDGGEVLLCRIENVRVDEALADPNRSLQDKMNAIRPACSTCHTYFGWDGRALGDWGEMMMKR